MFRRVLILIWLVVAAVSLLPGLGYYVTPIQERGYSDLHEQFSPAGIIGHGFGVVGTLFMIVGVTLYSGRKRLQRFSKLGSLKHWLDFHIFLCTLGPFLVVLHTSFKFGGIVSIAFWSMMAVVLSGVFGRYVYVWIPKTLNGRFLSVQTIQEEKKDVVGSIQKSAGLPSGEVQRILSALEPPQPNGIFSALFLSARFRLAKRSRQKATMNLLALEGIPEPNRVSITRLVENQNQIQQQIVLLRPFQQMFRYWHAFHLPLAIVMFVILIIHILVAVLFGYAWVFSSWG